MMKTLFLCALMSILLLNGCVSTKLERIKDERAELLKKERFRYALPKKQTKILKPKFPKVETAHLKNGLQIYVVSDKSLPIAHLHVAFKVGSSYDPRKKAGLTYLTARMLKEGTKEKSSLSMAKEFANIGSELSVATNKDSTHLNLSVLSTHLKKALNLLASVIKEPRFDHDDFRRIKGLHKSKLASKRGHSSYLAQLSFLKAAYGKKHPYAHPSDGNIKTINSIRLSDVKKNYKKHFGPSNAALIAVGDVSLEGIKKWAENNLSNLGASKQKSPDFKKLKSQRKSEMQTILVPKSGTPQTYLLIGSPVAKKDDKDLAYYEILQQILSGNPTSRLDYALREENGWTYGVSSLVHPLLDEGPFLVATSIQIPFGSNALGKILDEFEKLKNQPVTESELKAAKTQLLNSFANRYSTVGRIASHVANNFVYTLPLNRDEKLFESIKNADKQDILNVAKKIFIKDRLVAIAVGDTDIMKIPLARMEVGNVIVEGAN